MTREVLGEIEHLVLLGLLRLGGESYGVPIINEIGIRTGRQVSRAGVYIALKRLQAKGLVSSRIGEKTAERGGRARRYFTLTRAGIISLRQCREALVQMWQDYEPLLEH